MNGQVSRPDEATVFPKPRQQEKPPNDVELAEGCQDGFIRQLELGVRGVQDSGDTWVVLQLWFLSAQWGWGGGAGLPSRAQGCWKE